VALHDGEVQNQKWGRGKGKRWMSQPNQKVKFGGGEQSWLTEQEDLRVEGEM
jgi:hypothetical protein